MKRVLYVVVVLSVAFVFACGGGGDDPKVVFDDFFKAFEGYIDDMGKVGSADDVIKVTEKYSKTFQALGPKLKALKDKFKGKTPDEMPDYIKNFGEKFQTLMPKMMGLAPVLQKYMTDPKVMEAQKKFQEAMKNIM